VANERDAIRPFLGPAQERISVNELLDDLVAQYRLGGKKRIPREMEPGMRSNLRSVRDYFGEKRVATVTKRHVDEFISRLKVERKSNATVNRRTQLLSQAFKIAVNADPPKVLRPLAITKLDESDNLRKGKFTEQEAQLVFSRSLPDYLVDVGRFAYEVGSRRKELLNLRWSYDKGDAIEVPREDTKTRKPRTIALTPELKTILAWRRAAQVAGCDLIFHHDGHPIVDYRKAWHSACVVSGLGKFYCPKCRGEAGQYIFVPDATRKCPKCGEKPERPKYIGRLFHDFRRSAAYELWKAGSTVEECMEVTGHRTEAMFKRYADHFSDEERRRIQQKAQERRHEWGQAERERAAHAPDTPSVGEGAPQERDSERVQ
jgi:integrase